MSSLKTLIRLKNLKPYLVALDPEGHHAAVYNRKYEMMFEGASPALINYAIENHTASHNGFRLSEPEQQPSWMTSDMRDQCISYFLYNDASSVEALRKIPED